jgi:hypothetical protein
MSIREVVSYQNRLDNLFAQFRDFPPDNDTLRAHWPRYLCILTSGYLETSVRAILVVYAQEKSSPLVMNYVSKQLESLQNPKMEKICNLLGSFNSEWEGHLRANTEGELKDAVDSIVANRNNIAHGRDTGISYATVHEYYQSVKDVVALIEDLCAPLG